MPLHFSLQTCYGAQKRRKEKKTGDKPKRYFCSLQRFSSKCTEKEFVKSYSLQCTTMPAIEWEGSFHSLVHLRYRTSQLQHWFQRQIKKNIVPTILFSSSLQQIVHRLRILATTTATVRKANNQCTPPISYAMQPTASNTLIH